MHLPRPEQRRIVALAIVRFVLIFSAVIAIYYLLPLQPGAGPALEDLLGLALAFVLFAVVLWWQLRQILRADFPALRAVEGVAVVVPIFLCAYAVIYVLMSEADSATFTEPLTRTGALYLSVVVFGTVGFGDIVPVTDAARLVVSVQILCDLVFVAVVLRLFVLALRVSFEDHHPPEESRSGDPPD